MAWARKHGPHLLTRPILTRTTCVPPYLNKWDLTCTWNKSRGVSKLFVYIWNLGGMNPIANGQFINMGEAHVPKSKRKSSWCFESPFLQEQFDFNFPSCSKKLHWRGKEWCHTTIDHWGWTSLPQKETNENQFMQGACFTYKRLHFHDEWQLIFDLLWIRPTFASSNLLIFHVSIHIGSNSNSMWMILIHPLDYDRSFIERTTTYFYFFISNNMVPFQSSKT